MSGCLDNAHCPQIECPDLADKRNQIASIVAGALVRFFPYVNPASVSCFDYKNV